MCGLSAIYSYGAKAPPVDQWELNKISDHMTVRGPDGEGQWISRNGKLGLAHKRLAIIDTSDQGAQPMALLDDRGQEMLLITYNGEIYNFEELREELLQQGHRLTTRSDTEVLLHLYDRYGADMVEKLRGMYAFVIWDNRNNGIFMARDPFGIKPLYYSDDGQTIRIASQVKALLAGNKTGGAPDPAGHVGFFLLGYVPEPHTLYADVQAVPSGTTIWLEEGGNRKTNNFFDVRKHLADGVTNPYESEIAPKLRDVLTSSVRDHLVSDVPVGIFLSAGLDSTTLAGLASEISSASLISMTLQFKELSGSLMDEAPLAAEVASIYGMQHTTRTVIGSEFRNEINSLFASMDQPSIDGANTYFVAKEAASMGLKVALSGLGGDELFGGYPSFQQVPRLVNGLSWFPGLNFVGKAFRIISAPVLKQLTSSKYASLFEYGGSFPGAYLLRRGLYMPWELPEILDPDFAAEGWQKLELMIRLNETIEGIANDAAKVSALEILWYMRNQLLRDSDWAGMAHSLEIRTPLVDATLFRNVARMKASKKDLAGTLSKPLPDAILNRAKTGFYLPVREWLLGETSEEPQERGYRGWARKVYNGVS